MRFHDFIEYFGVLQEILFIADRIFTRESPNESSANHGHTYTDIDVVFMHSPSATLHHKVDMLQLISSSLPHTSKKPYCRGILSRDVPLPRCLENTFMFWHGINREDFRAVNSHIQVPHQYIQSQVRRSRKAHADKIQRNYFAAIQTRCLEAFQSHSYVPMPEESIVSRSQLTARVFHDHLTRRWVHLAGLGFEVYYFSDTCCNDDGALDVSYSIHILRYALIFTVD
jgi:hypothetical protein